MNRMMRQTTRAMIMTLVAGLVFAGCGNNDAARKDAEAKQAAAASGSAVQALVQADAKADAAATKAALDALDAKWPKGKGLSRDQRMLVAAIRGDAARKAGDLKAAETHYKFVGFEHRPMKQEAGGVGAEAAARARFGLIELHYKKFEGLSVAAGPKNYKEKFAEARGYLKEMSEHAGVVKTLGHPKWTIAALTRVGNACERFSDALLELGEDQDLTEDARKAVRAQLAKVQSNGAEVFLFALKLAHKEKIKNVWTRRADDGLLKLAPGLHKQLTSFH